MRHEVEPLIEIAELKTHFFLDEGIVRAVDGVDLEIYRNRTLCVVGESGCGKSVTAESILQIVDPPGRIVEGEIRFHQTVYQNGSQSSQVIDLAALHPRSRTMRDIRGKDIAMIFQEPMTSLSPIHTIGDQIAEAIQLHLAATRQEARQRAVELLRQVGIPRPAEHFDSYPFQLSGGMRQRAMIAMALSCNPSLLIADEPTTAVDVTTQAQILDLLQELQAEYGMGILLITHDLGVVAEMADDVAVMYLGRVVERGDVDTIFHDPQHPYTRALLRSIPKLDVLRQERLNSIRGMVPDPYNRPGGCPFHARCDVAMSGRCDTTVPPRVRLSPGREVSCLLFSEPGLAPEVAGSPAVDGAEGRGELSIHTQADRASTAPSANGSRQESLLEVRNLRMHFPIQTGFFRRTVGHVRAVDDVSFFIRQGETLGLVGESGCGKTTAGRCIMRAYAPTGGQILYRKKDGGTIDLTTLSNNDLRPYRQQIRMIFQDPYSSLNPRMPVLEVVGEPLIVHKIAAGQELEDRVAALLRRVGLRPEYMRRYPHAFSGGERQRIGIARSLALDPRLIVADEAVSALDVSVRAQILNLLQDLQEELGLTYLFVSHDLSVVAYLCNRVAVMYVGKLVEVAGVEEIFSNPKHPYSEALLSAVPRPDPRLRRRAQRIVLEGDVADPANPPGGCYFHPRCPYVQERCRVETPALGQVADDHFAACHFAEELHLRGFSGDTK